MAGYFSKTDELTMIRGKAFSYMLEREGGARGSFSASSTFWLPILGEGL